MMNSVSNAARTLVVVLCTLVSGSTLMLATLGPGLAPASAQVAVAARA